MWVGARGAASCSRRRIVSALRKRAAAGLEDQSLYAQPTAEVLPINILVLLLVCLQVGLGRDMG
jgi:hypothetical protein